jgi:aminomethyltransferase
MSETELIPATLATTPLHALHLARAARMVPFAGYEMPVQYDGIIAEHLHTRAAAGLFDVSHMGQLFLIGPDHEATARALEARVAADIVGLAPGRQRYTQLLNEDGGMIDDLMVTRPADVDEDGVLMLVVNASRKAVDAEHLERQLPANVKLLRAEQRALVALQGPSAAAVLGRHAREVASLPFMSAVTTRFDGIECHVSRSGYTGEDGFEISVNAIRVRAIVERLLEHREVKLIGLGARDSLRLEAGLCLYGHDINTTTTPVEAALTWAIQKVRRPGGARAGGYPGARAIEGQLATGPVTKRVGLVGLERMPVREGAKLFDAHGRALGHVTSGTLAPTVNQPIAMAYLAANHALPNHEVYAEVRGKRVPMRVAPMPFTPHRYHRG